MKTPLTILVTGGIGSGKSTVCAHFASLGIPVYDSDSRAKSLYDRSSRLSANINAAFGGDLLDSDGHLDRAKLSERVFASSEALERLESLVHPAVLEDFRDWRDTAGSDIVVLESAIAASLPSFMAEVDRVLLVRAPHRDCIARAALRDGVSGEKIAQRIQRQAEKQNCQVREPDYIIENDGSPEQLYSKADEVLRNLKTIKTN
jgi:dephospho-CoA kinase